MLIILVLSFCRMLSCTNLNFFMPSVDYSDIRNVDNFGIVGKISNVGAVGQ